MTYRVMQKLCSIWQIFGMERRVSSVQHIGFLCAWSQAVSNPVQLIGLEPLYAPRYMLLSGILAKVNKPIWYSSPHLKTTYFKVHHGFSPISIFRLYRPGNILNYVVFYVWSTLICSVLTKYLTTTATTVNVVKSSYYRNCWV